jgi:hypothetical protein
VEVEILLVAERQSIVLEVAARESGARLVVIGTYGESPSGIYREKDASPTRRPAWRSRRDVLGDVASVVPDSSDVLRGGRVLEGQPEKVQARRGIHHAPVVEWIAATVEDG